MGALLYKQGFQCGDCCWQERFSQLSVDYLRSAWPRLAWGGRGEKVRRLGEPSGWAAEGS